MASRLAEWHLPGLRNMDQERARDARLGHIQRRDDAEEIVAPVVALDLGYDVGIHSRAGERRDQLSTVYRRRID